ncbi:sortase [Candidatus Poriferisocius sp.]|uniref:sortase n=1 Tax=Candidatus Poriferisocius sp. TaxID=3101276 RepID=UPI003B02377E
MTVVRVLGAFGKTVIAIGLIILLFGIFQLWGTGVIEARAQRGLDSEFSDLLENAGALGAPTFNQLPAATPPPPAPPQPTTNPATIPEPTAPPQPDPATTPQPTPEPTAHPQPTPEPDPAWLEMLYPKWGSALARIHIPSLGVSKTVVEGVRVSDLRKGPGHYPNTPLPGQAGNAAIAGHRTTYGAPFGDIDELVPGNQIFVETIQGRFVYQVVAQEDDQGHFIVPPDAVEVLDQNFSDHPNRLTLTACHPKGSARQRIIVVAELVGQPAPTYPRPGSQEPAPTMIADENLDGAGGNDQTVAETPTPEAAGPGSAPTPEAAGPGSAPTPEAAGPGSAPTPTPTAVVAADENPDGTGSNQSLDGTAGVTGAGSTGPPGAGRAGAGAPNPASPSPAPAPVTDSFGEGLNGDSDALVPAILWGLAALAVWFAALFAGYRWRRFPAYALSALPFLVVLFMAFWHIDRIIPSY